MFNDAVSMLLPPMHKISYTSTGNPLNRFTDIQNRVRITNAWFNKLYIIIAQLSFTSCLLLKTSSLENPIIVTPPKLISDNKLSWSCDAYLQRYLTINNFTGLVWPGLVCLPQPIIAQDWSLIASTGVDGRRRELSVVYGTGFPNVLLKALRMVTNCSLFTKSCHM